MTVTLDEQADEVRAAVEAAAIARTLRAAKLPGVIDVVPAFGSVSVFYDVLTMPARGGSAFDRICDAMRPCIDAARPLADHLEDDVSTVEIIVSYGGNDGPDLERLANEKGIREGELVEMHSSAEYTVLAIGFMPGFAYLGGLPEALHAPRLATPRTRVPPGSLAIGGRYTGVYPYESPGGWNLIGRTDAMLMNPQSAEAPALLRVGQKVKFRPSRQSRA